MIYFALAYLLLVLGCYSTDPGPNVNHVHLGPLAFDPVWSAVVSALCTLVVAPIIVKLITRAIARSDADKINALRKLEEEHQRAEKVRQDLEGQRHENIICKLTNIEQRFIARDKRFIGHEHLLKLDGRLHVTEGKVGAEDL